MSSYQNSSGNQPTDVKCQHSAGTTCSKCGRTGSTVCKVSQHNRNAEQLVDGYSMKQNNKTLTKMAKKVKGK
jgi:hypothetical protein